MSCLVLVTICCSHESLSRSSHQCCRMHFLEQFHRWHERSTPSTASRLNILPCSIPLQGPFRVKIISHHSIRINEYLGKFWCSITGNFFRNFVVQHVLELSNPMLTQKICSMLRGKYVELSLLRYGSHVVEKCLKSPGMAHYAVEDFLKSSSQLFHLARHKYGNYVIQTALKVTKVFFFFSSSLKIFTTFNSSFCLISSFNLQTENISLHRRLLNELQDCHDLQLGFGKKLYNLIAAGVPVDGDSVWCTILEQANLLPELVYTKNHEHSMCCHATIIGICYLFL